MKPYYGADEFLEVECISNESLPAARLEWLINDRPLGVIQPPSRLEFATLPATTNRSGGDGSNSSITSRKSSKSSLRQKQLFEMDADESTGGSPLDSNSLQYHSPEFTVPVAAAVVASAAALSLTTASSQLASSAPVLPSPSAVYSTASSSKKSPSGGKKAAPVARYETAISRLKLLLGHEHFDKGKIKVSRQHPTNAIHHSVFAFCVMKSAVALSVGVTRNGIHYRLSFSDSAPLQSVAALM